MIAAVFVNFYRLLSLRHERDRGKVCQQFFSLFDCAIFLKNFSSFHLIIACHVNLINQPWKRQSLTSSLCFYFIIFICFDWEEKLADSEELIRLAIVLAHVSNETANPSKEKPQSCVEKKILHSKGKWRKCSRVQSPK